MIKKALVVTGVFAMSAIAAATVTFAQTTTTGTTNTTVTPKVDAMQKTIPAGAPATGRAQ